MIIELDTSSDIPIYVQMRNQIVLGIGRGELKIGESLPTVRQMAEAAQVNAMTVNKVYALLKAEGYIEIDRRHGAAVLPRADNDTALREKCNEELELLITESTLKGMTRETFLDLCGEIFDRQKITELEEVVPVF